MEINELTKVKAELACTRLANEGKEMSDKIFKPVADVFALIHAGGEPYHWTQEAILAAEWLRENSNYSVKEFVSLDRYQAAVTDDLSAMQQKLDETEALLYAMRHDMRESREKMDAVLSENVALRKSHPQPFGPIMMQALEAYEKDREQEPETGMLNAFFILRDSINIQTPATDAILNEVRAEGVEMFVKDYAYKLRTAGGGDGYHYEPYHDMADHIEEKAELYIAQLRAGSTEGANHD